jgi:hypothetical protein
MKEEIIETEAMVEVKKKTDDIIDCAENLLIRDESDRGRIAEFLLFTKAIRAKIVNLREQFQRPAYDLYQNYKSYFDEKEKPVIEAEKIAKDKESDYLIAEENRRKREQEEIDRKAEAERKKREAALLARADREREKGNDDKADNLTAQAGEVFIPTAIVTPVQKSVQIENGMTTAGDDIRIIKIEPLVVAQNIARGNIPIHYVNIIYNKDGFPTSLSIVGLKKFMKSNFGCRDITFAGITVEKIKVISTRRG